MSGSHDDPPSPPTLMVRAHVLLGVPLRLATGALAPLRRFPWPFRPGKNTDKAIATVQYEILERALSEAGGLGAAGKGFDESYLYRPGHLLVREGDLDAVQRHFDGNQERYRGTGEPERVFDGLVRLTLPTRADGGDVPETLADLERNVGDDVARPDHVLYVTIKGTTKLCPAIEPRRPRQRGPFPAINPDPSAGAGVRVSVVDTGWWEPAAKQVPWLSSDVGGEVEHVDPAHIHPYAGHGTFVAGVIRCQAPATQVDIEAVLPHGGAAFESEVMQQLHDAMESREDPQLISISAGTYTRNDRGLLAFETLFAAEERREGERAVLVVAAAGNDATSRPFWPAAYDWVVGVGSVDVDGGVSTYSNTGKWVSVYALGRDLVNAFPVGDLTYHEPPLAGQVAHFEGMARWSGTSFSTPMVTGAVAARMSRTGATARDAYADLLAGGSTVTDPRAGSIVVV